jgi:hypothetical protein
VPRHWGRVCSCPDTNSPESLPRYVYYIKSTFFFFALAELQKQKSVVMTQNLASHYPIPGCSDLYSKHAIYYTKYKSQQNVSRICAGCQVFAAYIHYTKYIVICLLQRVTFPELVPDARSLLP